MIKLLLMEDDAVLSDILLDFLREFYDIDYAFNTNEAAKLLEGNHYDLFIFDINVPGKTGLQLLKELRDFNNTTPAIIITAYNDIEHLQKSFDAGAHDYIKKPFDLQELHTRIENSKRIFNIELSQTIQISDDIVYDEQKHQLTNKNTIYTLTVKESEILKYFLTHPSRTISNDELAQNLWEYDNMPSNATIRSHIRKLRETLGKKHFSTIRGVGYRFERSSL